MSRKQKTTDASRKKGASRFLLPALILLLLLAGVGMFCYPMVSNWLAERNHLEVIREYSDALAAIDEETNEAEWEKAVAYNNSLAGDPVRDPFLEGSGSALPRNYMEVLDINGIMGSVEIPKIGVNLPIYHGVEEEVLRKGAGHIPQTALPVGGAGSHAVLTGHTGLPSAQLFTGLDQLQEGDYFFLKILNHTLAYQVDAINVVEPYDVALLDPIPGEDYVTLITCTPYGVNTHRLLVRGTRVEYTEEVEEAAQLQAEENTEWSMQDKITFIMAVSSGSVILLTILILLILRAVRRKRSRKKEKAL